MAQSILRVRCDSGRMQSLVASVVQVALSRYVMACLPPDSFAILECADGIDIVINTKAALPVCNDMQLTGDLRSFAVDLVVNAAAKSDWNACVGIPLSLPKLAAPPGVMTQASRYLYAAWSQTGENFGLTLAYGDTVLLSVQTGSPSGALEYAADGIPVQICGVRTEGDHSVLHIRDHKHDDYSVLLPSSIDPLSIPAAPVLFLQPARGQIRREVCAIDQRQMHLFFSSALDDDFRESTSFDTPLNPSSRCSAIVPELSSQLCLFGFEQYDTKVSGPKTGS
jgi:hypothetical protein